MSKLLRVFAVIAVTFVFPAIAYAQQDKPMTEDQKSVLAVIERMTEAFHNGDINGVMANYEDAATVLFEPGIPVSGPAVLREMFQGAFAINPHFAYSGHEVVVAGDIAVHFAPWKMKGTSPDGAEIKQSGLSVAVLRKQADGGWAMVIDNPHGQRLMGN